jgi:hypothetical protein
MLWLAAAALAILGVSLVIAGTRGRRVDDHPVCRRCRFDLIGVYGGIGEERCPECGSSLGDSAAVRIGNRRRRARVLGAGATLVCIFGLLVAVLGWGAATGFNWNTLKPFWLLEREALRSSDPSTVDAALAEVQDRLGAGRLSRIDIEPLLDAALAQQAAQQDQTPQAWLELFVAALGQHMVTDERIVQFARQSSHGQVALRSPTPSGALLFLTLERWSGDVRGQTGLRLKYTPLRLEIGDRTLTDLPAYPILDSLGGTGRGFTYFRIRLNDVEPGEHQTRAVFGVTVHPEGGRDADPIGAWEHEFTVPLTVLPAGSPVVELVQGPELRDLVRGSIEITEAHLSNSPGMGDAIWMYPKVRDCPVDLVSTVVLRAEGREWQAGPQFAAIRGSAGQDAIFMRVPEGFDARRVDVILRPSPGHAEANTAATRLWNEEIVLEGVEVRWLPTVERRRRESGESVPPEAADTSLPAPPP